MDLFPTAHSQVCEMLWCSSQCENLNGSSSTVHNRRSSSPEVICQPYFNFEDYSSAFNSEMKRSYNSEQLAAAPAPKIPHLDNSDLMNASDFIKMCNADKTSLHRKVFLGGSCNPTTWRRDIAIPMLNNLGVTFFNPQVSDWEPSLIQKEHEARENADVLFYVIDNQTRAVVVMIEVAYFVAKKRKVVLVESGFKEPGQRISNEPISRLEYEELTRGQLILQELVERHSIPIFNDIKTAIRCTAKIIKENIRLQDLNFSDLTHPLKMKLLQINNKIINLKTAFDNLANAGSISFADVKMTYRMMTNKELTQEHVRVVVDSLRKAVDELLILPPSHTIGQNGFGDSELTLDFEHFCCIMPELLISHEYNSSPLNWSHILSVKSTQFVQSLFDSLNKLLDNTPHHNNCDPCQTNVQHESENHLEYDVCLEGVDNLTVITTLREKGLTVFDLMESNKRSPHIQLASADLRSIEKCQAIFVCISGKARCVEEMAKAAYYFGIPSISSKVVVYMQYLEEDCVINGEKLSKIAVKDYNRGRSYLADMARRENVPVFDDLSAATDCVFSLCKKS